jgi:hypothetical protein
MSRSQDNHTPSAISIVYGLLLSLTIIGSLALAATFLIRRSRQENQITDASFTIKNKQDEGQVAGVNEEKIVDTYNVKIQDFNQEKVIITLTNNTKEPLFFNPNQELKIINSAGELIPFENKNERIVIVSQETKNIDISGEFSDAQTLTISPANQETKSIPFR